MNSLYTTTLLLILSILTLSAGQKPNIVVIISDDQGFHDYGFMGHEKIETPHLDKLASESLLFERGYVTTALCCPSLATMLTGVYPHQHGYTGNDPVSGKWVDRAGWVDKFKTVPQFPSLLQEAGYLSLHTGKYWQGHPEVSGFTHTMGETKRHGSKESLDIGREGLGAVYDFISEATDAEKPFMVWYAPFMPHTPHTPPERLYNKYKGATNNEGHDKYYAMVDWFDETCGDLLNHLDEKGLTENTVIFYICDNGWPAGEKGYRGHKFTPYEQGIRTPIMVKWLNKVTPMRDKESLASNLDLVPTLLKVAGVNVPKELEGIDLLNSSAVSARDTLYFQDFTHDMIAPDRAAETLEARGIIKGWDKYLETYERDKDTIKILKKENFLFDLKADPKEAKNLFSDKTELVQGLKKELDTWYNPPLVENPLGK